MKRRAFLGAGGATLAGLLLPALTHPGQRVVEVRMLLDDVSGAVAFDPVGVFVEPGTRVRWINGKGVHTVTAYHPHNEGRALRIPEAAQPWDSGYLMQPGAVFEHELSVPGVYDYFCRPHERAGMAGRLVVGSPTGPGARPFNWWRGEHSWQEVSRAAQKRLPAVEAIVSSRRIPAR